MSVISTELSDDDVNENSSLFETAADVCYLSQYKNLEGYVVQKSKFICSRDEFIKKFRINVWRRNFQFYQNLPSL